MIRHVRFHQAIPNKKDCIPMARAVHVQSDIPVLAYKTVQGQAGLVIDPDLIERFFHSFQKSRKNEVLFSEPPDPPEHLMERFMGKCCLEILAQRVCPYPGWRAATVLRRELNQIRRFARYGDGGRWPVHVRRIYPADQAFPSLTGEPSQTLFEYDLLYTHRTELYAVLAIFGVELTINLVGPELGGYQQWLIQHRGVSPLYTREGRFRM